jgi:hypothetical protein
LAGAVKSVAITNEIMVVTFLGQKQQRKSISLETPGVE